MADDKGGTGDGGIFSTINTADLNKTTKATGDLSDTQRDLVDNANELQKTVDANTDALREYGRGADDAKRKLETLGEAWKKQYDSVVQSTHALVTFNSKVHEAGGAITGFMGKMKEAISLGGMYENVLKELATSQKAYLTSLNLSSASYGTAAKEHQKYLSAINSANISAGETARKYSIDIKEVREAQDAVTKAFNTQIGASGKHQKSIESLREQTILFSKYMGTEMKEAVEFMDSRLQHSGKTISEVQTETWRVVAAADAYTISLTKMGDRARKTANITRREFLESIKETAAQFKIGSFDAGAYSEDLAKYLEAAKKTGAYSKSEMSLMMKQYGGLLGKMQSGDLSSYFGVTASQEIAKRFASSGLQSSNSEVRNKVTDVLKQTGGDTSSPQAIRMLSEATRGSPELTKLMFEQIRASIPKDVFREMIYKESGVKFQRGADFLAQATGEGGVLTQGEEGSRAKLTKEEQKKLREKIDKLTGTVKQGSTPTKEPWKTVADIRGISQDILNTMKNYYPLMLAAMALQGAGSVAQAARGAAAVRGASALIPGAANTTGSASRVGSVASRVLGVGRMGVGGAMRTGLGALGVVGGVAAAGYGGYKLGEFIDKKFGVSDWLSSVGFEHLKNVRTVRADNTDAMEKLAKDYTTAADLIEKHNAGIIYLNEKELKAKKKLVEATKEEAKRQIKWTSESDRTAHRQRGRDLVGSAAEVGGGIDEWLKGGGRSAWMRKGGVNQLSDLLEGKTVEGTSKEASDYALATLKEAAKQSGMAWDDYKKLIKERAAVASLTGSAGAYGDRKKFLEKKTGTDLTGKSETAILDLWVKNVSKQEAQTAGLSLPEDLRKSIEERSKTSVNVSASVGDGEGDGSIITPVYNPVNQTLTYKRNLVITQVVDARTEANAYGHVQGQSEPTTTNAPGK